MSAAGHSEAMEAINACIDELTPPEYLAIVRRLYDQPAIAPLLVGAMADYRAATIRRLLAPPAGAGGSSIHGSPSDPPSLLSGPLRVSVYPLQPDNSRCRTVPLDAPTLGELQRAIHKEFGNDPFKLYSSAQPFEWTKIDSDAQFRRFLNRIVQQPDLPRYVLLWRPTPEEDGIGASAAAGSK